MEIILNNVSVTYMKNTPFEKQALKNINLKVSSGTITGIVGHTGSGKSTLAQVIAGLIKPDYGEVKIDNYNWNNKKDLFNLRKQVGFVFQFPEQQLFAETVEDDIAYALKNFDFKQELIIELIQESMAEVGLPYEIFARKSPFHLSGGQMRRAAIAGVLAYKPKILIFDEPTAGLDPSGKNEMIKVITELKKELKTILIISHSMDEIAKISDKLIVLQKGELVAQGKPELIFRNKKLLQQTNLDLPEITKIIIGLNQKVNPPIPLDCFEIEDLEYYLLERLKENK